jgi:hypothetical protein
MNVTRNVIADLWPQYADDTASADTRALVDEFLRQDPQWGGTLRRAAEDSARPLPPPTVTPDQEARSLNRIKWRFRWMRWMLLLAMVFSCQAFGRIVADTSWDVSPRNFIIVASVAGVFWIGFIITLVRLRGLGP